LINLLKIISEKSFKEREIIYLTIDLDNQKYLISKEGEEKKLEIENLPEGIFIFRAKNSKEEKESGTITFTFFPDRTKEYGMIYLENLYNGETFTVFLYPYSENIEIYEGEVYFENI